MIPAAFDYQRATTADEAIALLTEHGDEAKLLAGGHSLLPLMKLRLATPAMLIDVGRLKELSYIREVVGLTGTNVGCDTSSCGACTVLIDGESIKSCTVLAVQADGQSITTIEGLADPDGTMHPMQQAFQENHGLQCGYCTPGMVLAAVSLLQENPNPDEAQVREGLEGNLCRCTGYHNIVKSVLAAAGSTSGSTAAVAGAGAAGAAQ